MQSFMHRLCNLNLVTTTLLRRSHRSYLWLSCGELDDVWRPKRGFRAFVGLDRFAWKGFDQVLPIQEGITEIYRVKAIGKSFVACRSWITIAQKHFLKP